MLTKDDLKEIKQLFKPFEGRFDNLEGKVDKLSEDIEDLKLETRAIHEIIKTQSSELENRIQRLEEHVDIN